MAHKAKHDRLQSSTRLDVVTMMLTSRATAVPQQTSRYHSMVDLRPDGFTKSGTVGMVLSAQTPRKVASQDAFKRKQVQTATAVASWERPLPLPPQSTTNKDACPPRSSRPRPRSLTLSSTNGYSTLSSPDLKQRICSARSSNDTSATLQVPAPDRREQLPPTPTTPLSSLVMGNSHSSNSGSPAPDDRSMRSVVHIRRHSKPMIRKSSSNLLKRLENHSPLPREVTASVMSVLHRDGTKKDPTDDALVGVPTDPFFNRPDQYDHRYPGRSPGGRVVHSTSTVTITEGRANMPLSPSTTIRDFTSSESERNDSKTEFPRIEEPDPEDELLENLSPTIPAPSPLPEDSPHKYGLRYATNTPPVPHGTPDIQVPKARRKSSGLEIFKEAQTLQQASSFLNGLSTARRRAESVAAIGTDTTIESWCNVTAQDSRQSSTLPSSQPATAYHDGEGRKRGHNFKSSGFAYTRPLTLTQLKCYRSHAKLLLSRNKHAPVECAVCHIDDEGEHFSCSWCALRMCKYCRKEFAERGISALQERIKIAEMGGRIDSAHSSSSESFEHLVAVTSNST